MRQQLPSGRFNIHQLSRPWGRSFSTCSRAPTLQFHAFRSQVDGKKVQRCLPFVRL